MSYTDDSYEAVERRRWAATILDCPELLMMHAQARQDVRLPLFFHPFTFPLFPSHLPSLPSPSFFLGVRFSGKGKGQERWTWTNEMIDDTVDEVAFHEATVWV